jgi:hypothetical protein
MSSDLMSSVGELVKTIEDMRDKKELLRQQILEEEGERAKV